MPIMMIHMIEGRTQEQKENFIAALTDAAEATLQAPRESVRVLLQEMPKEHFGIAGISAKKLGR
jgi:4-oxalocrotonate tautomerase